MAPILLSGLFFIALAVFMGLRFVRVFRREGRAPELFVGLSFIATSIGMVGGFVAITPGTPDGLVRVAFAAGGIGIALAGAAVLRFNSLSFQAGKAKAQLVAHAGLFVGVLIAALSAARAADAEILMLRSYDTVSVVPLLFLAACLAWLSVSSLGHWRQLSRRAAIGLADPLMVNRMLLYGVGGVLSTLSILIMAVPVIAFGWDPLENPVLRVLGVPLGVPIGPIYYLALIPPARYERWLKRRAEVA